MHIRIKKTEIQEKLSKIQNIVEKKSIMQVLNHFLMDITGTSGYILATDLETAVKQPIKIEIIEPGKACIPAKKFYEIVRELDEDIEIFLQEKWLKIQSGRSNFRLAIMDWSEFPVWPQIGDSVKLDFSRDLLLTAIDKTIYASGESDTRYFLNGLLLHLKEPKKFTVVGTDGHRLAIFRAKMEDFNLTEEKKVILSKKSLNELKRFLTDADIVTLYVGKTHVMFEMDGISFLTRMIEGNYPDYEMVIPKNNDKIIIVDKNLLISSLKRVSVLSKEHYNAVRIDLKEDLLILSASDPELGEAVDELSVEYQNEPFSIGFNAKYLIEAIDKITSDKAKISMSEPERAVYITDAFEGESFSYESVVMPLRL